MDHRESKKKKPINFATDKNGNIIFRKGLTFKEWFKTVHMPLLFDFFRWVLIDWYRGKDEKIFGIYMFCGLFGEGKTIGMVKHALDLKLKNPDIKIFANFNCSFADGKLDRWQDLLNLPHRSIAMIDEIQGTFQSADWADFPPELLLNICQVRKRQIMLLCSAQAFADVTVQIRRLVHYVIQSKNILGADRMFRYEYYRRPEYEKYCDDISQGRKAKVQPIYTKLFISDDEFYSNYDTSEIIESMKKKEDKKKNKPLIVIN